MENSQPLQLKRVRVTNVRINFKRNRMFVTLNMPHNTQAVDAVTQLQALLTSKESVNMTFEAVAVQLALPFDDVIDENEGEKAEV
jgi:antitoxin component of RelBE/YafQ-DinJ toxin-antitoxin module